MNQSHRLELVPPRQEDYASLVDWIGDAHACARWAGPLLRFPLDVVTLADDLAVGGSTSYFLRAADTAANPIGFGQHRVIEPGGVHLGRILLAPEVRGMGLGQVLCRQLIARAVAATGAAQVTLRVYRDNPAAIALYRRFGFAEVPQQSDEAVFFMRASVAGMPFEITCPTSPN